MIPCPHACCLLTQRLRSAQVEQSASVQVACRPGGNRGRGRRRCAQGGLGTSGGGTRSSGARTCAWRGATAPSRTCPTAWPASAPRCATAPNAEVSPRAPCTPAAAATADALYPVPYVVPSTVYVEAIVFEHLYRMRRPCETLAQEPSLQHLQHASSPAMCI